MKTRRPGAGRKPAPLTERKPTRGRISIDVAPATAAKVQRLMLHAPPEVRSPAEMIDWLTSAALVDAGEHEWLEALPAALAVQERNTAMNAQTMAAQARELIIDDGVAAEQAITTVVRAALDRLSGTYTAQAERQWCNEVRRALSV